MTKIFIDDDIFEMQDEDFKIRWKYPKRDLVNFEEDEFNYIITLSDCKITVSKKDTKLIKKEWFDQYLEE